MKQKQFAPQPCNCFYEAKNPCFCFIVAKSGSKQKECSDMDLAIDLTGDAGAIFCSTEAS
jgi:hypothetical protein